jgi:predicted RNA-binding Zn ribbon-like protein
MTATHAFTLAGGHPVLDFVNTVEDWTVPERLDHLQSFADAARFGEAAGVISHREALQLDPGAQTRGARGFSRASVADELLQLRRLRGSLERVLRASLGGRRAAAADVAILRSSLVEAARGTEFVASAEAPLARRIAVESNGPAALRLRIVEDAIALLSSSAMPRVKACPTCGWFFLDVSKNQSRVWCSMDTCGARAKSRRYYRRTRRRRRNSQS